MTPRASNVRAPPDKVITDIADYAYRYKVKDKLAWQTARLALIDSLGCGFAALSHPACTKLLGPLVAGADMPGGVRVPGTPYQLDPVRAAFNLGAMIRWLDYSDWIFGRNGGHPSDNVGGILATADYVSRRNLAAGKAPLAMRDVLEAMIKAYEIQGQLGMLNSFTSLGMDNTMLVKIATCAVAAKLLGCTRDEIVNAVSNAWIDGYALTTFRRGPNTGSRKSWAAGDATSRGVWLALMAARGEMGYPSALTAERSGFYDLLFNGKPFKFQRSYGTYIMQNVLFKIGYPTAFHGQSAAESAIRLHPLVDHRLNDIERVEVRCHRAAMTIMNKSGPLHNPADRDHCMQYIIAIGMIFGKLSAADYEDGIAADPRIDALRAKMKLVEYARYESDYHDAAKHSNASAIQVFFKDGGKTPLFEVEYPLGHCRRRREGLPLLMQKFEANVAGVFAAKQRNRILAACLDQRRLESMSVNEFVDLTVF